MNTSFYVILIVIKEKSVHVSTHELD